MQTAEMNIQDMPTTDIMSEIARLAPLKQHHLTRDMTDGRPLARQAAEKVLANLRGCEDRPVVERPEKSSPSMDFSLIPVGYYATPGRGSNEFDFWKVERPEDGKYAGFTFIKRVLGGGSAGQTRVIRIHMSEQRLSLAAIARHGIEESRQLYGDKMKRCTKCNRDLTDDLSIARRMGNDCWNKRQGAL
jgi:hypothetical protein